MIKAIEYFSGFIRRLWSPGEICVDAKIGETKAHRSPGYLLFLLELESY